MLPILHYNLLKTVCGSCVILFQAEVQKMRVEMASMKRDAEHYSRQVSNCIIFLFFSVSFYLLVWWYDVLSSVYKLRKPCIKLHAS